MTRGPLPDDIRRHLEQMEPDEVLNVFGVRVQRHHGRDAVFALIDDDRKGCLRCPGDAAATAARVLSESRRRRKAG
jgi:hypothetical protein